MLHRALVMITRTDMSVCICTRLSLRLLRCIEKFAAKWRPVDRTFGRCIYFKHFVLLPTLLSFNLISQQFIPPSCADLTLNIPMYCELTKSWLMQTRPRCCDQCTSAGVFEAMLRTRRPRTARCEPANPSSYYFVFKL